MRSMIGVGYMEITSDAPTRLTALATLPLPGEG